MCWRSHPNVTVFRAWSFKRELKYMTYRWVLDLIVLVVLEESVPLLHHPLYAQKKESCEHKVRWWLPTRQQKKTEWHLAFLSASLATYGVINLCILAILIDAQWYLTVVLIFINLMASEFEHIFMCLHGFCVSFQWNTSSCIFSWKWCCCLTAKI